MDRLPFPVRCVVLVLGMCLAALGIALITNADMGTTPITSLPLAVNAVYPLSVGTYTVLLNALFVLLEKFILGPHFSRANVLQLPPVFLFGFFIDMWMHLSGSILLLPYAERLCILAAGIVVLAFGILLQVACNLVVQPGEGIVLALAFRTRRNFGNLKVMVDAGMVASAALLGLICLGHIVGIREGTLLSACLTGFCIRGLGALLHRLCPRLFHPAGQRS